MYQICVSFVQFSQFFTEADKGHKLSLQGCRFHFVASTLSLPSCRFHVVALKIKGGGLYCGTRTEISAGLWGSTIVVSYFCIFIFLYSHQHPPHPPPPQPSFQVVASTLSLPRGRLPSFHVFPSCELLRLYVRTCPLWARKLL